MIARIARASSRTRLLLAAGLAALVIGGALVVYALTSSGSAGPDVEAAPKADAEECARLAGHYPEQLAGLERDSTDIEGVAAWGDGEVVVRCGMEPPRPSADSCATIDGVDWLWRENESGDGRKVLLTYGRVPGVEARISDQVEALDGVLVELSELVKPIEQRKKCLS